MKRGIDNITPYVKDLTEIFTKIVTSKYNDIALIVMYGSRARGDYAEFSDVEYFAITDNPINPDLSFLFRNVTVDFGSQTWDSIEKIANRDTYWIHSAGTLATCKVVFARSENDLQRFETLRSRVIQNHERDDITHSDDIEKTYQDMVQSLGTILVARKYDDFHEVHCQIWGLINGYTILMSKINGKHLINNWGKNLDEVFSFPHQPTGVQDIINKLIGESDVDIIIALGSELVDKVRKFILALDDEIPAKEPQIDMLSSVHGLEYLLKIIKAIDLKHLPALGYAIIDTQPLIAKDLVKLQDNWKTNSNLQLYSEYSSVYEERFPDLLKLMLQRRFDKLRHEIFEMRGEIKKIVKEQMDLPSFQSLEQIKKYYDVSVE